MRVLSFKRVILSINKEVLYYVIDLIRVGLVLFFVLLCFFFFFLHLDFFWGRDIQSKHSIYYQLNYTAGKIKCVSISDVRDAIFPCYFHIEPTISLTLNKKLENKVP